MSADSSGPFHQLKQTVNVVFGWVINITFAFRVNIVFDEVKRSCFLRHDAIPIVEHDQLLTTGLGDRADLVCLQKMLIQNFI